MFVEQMDLVNQHEGDLTGMKPFCSSMCKCYCEGAELYSQHRGTSRPSMTVTDAAYPTSQKNLAPPDSFSLRVIASAHATVVTVQRITNQIVWHLKLIDELSKSNPMYGLKEK